MLICCSFNNCKVVGSFKIFKIFSYIITFLSEQDFDASNFLPVSGSKNPNDVIGLSPFIISIMAITISLFLSILLSILSCLIQESYSIVVIFKFNSLIHELFLYRIIVKF